MLQSSRRCLCSKFKAIVIEYKKTLKFDLKQIIKQTNNYIMVMQNGKQQTLAT